MTLDCTVIHLHIEHISSLSLIVVIHLLGQEKLSGIGIPLLGIFHTHDYVAVSLHQPFVPVFSLRHGNPPEIAPVYDSLIVCVDYGAVKLHMHTDGIQRIPYKFQLTVIVI